MYKSLNVLINCEKTSILIESLVIQLIYTTVAEA